MWRVRLLVLATALLAPGGPDAQARGGAAREFVSRPMLEHLVAEAAALTGDPTPADLPVVVAVGYARLQELGCARAGALCTPLALFRPDEPDRIYALDLLEPDARLGDRAVLLHEVVHWLQQKRADPGGACEREREAYRVQARYLVAHGATLRSHVTSPAGAGAGLFEWSCP
jgi:hypothetical protein